MPQNKKEHSVITLVCVIGGVALVSLGAVGVTSLAKGKDTIALVCVWLVFGLALLILTGVKL